MTRKNRTMVEKSQGDAVFKNNASGEIAADDFAKKAGWIEQDFSLDSFRVDTCADSADKSAL